MARRTPSPATKQDRGDLHRSCRGPAPNGVVVRPAISLGTPRRPRNASPNPARVAPNPPRPVVHQQHTEGDYELALKGFIGLPTDVPEAFRKARSASSLMVEIMRMDHSVFSSMILDANTVAEAKVPAACLYRNMQLAKSTVKGLEKKEQKTKDPGGQMAKLAATLTSLRKHETVRDLMILKDLVREVDVSTNLFDPLIAGLRNQELAMHNIVQSSLLRMRRNAALGQGAAPAQLPAQGMVPAQAAQAQGPPQRAAPASQGAASQRPAARTQGSAQVQGPAQQGVGRAAQGPPQRSALPAHGARLQQPAPPSHGAPARSHVTNGSLGDGQARTQGSAQVQGPAQQGVGRAAQGPPQRAALPAHGAGLQQPAPPSHGAPARPHVSNGSLGDGQARTQGSAQVQGSAQQGVGRAAQGPPQRSALPAHGAGLQQPAPPSHGAPARPHVSNGSLGDGQARAQGAQQGIAQVAQGAGTLPANSNQRAPARTQGINGNRQDQQVPGSSSDQRSPVRRRSSPTIAPLTPKRRRSSSPPGTVSSALVPSAVANAMAQLSTQPQPLTVPPTSSTTAHRLMMTVQGSSRPAQTSNPGVQAAARMPDRSLPSQNRLSSPTPSATLSAPPPVPKKQVVSTDNRTAPISPSFNRGPANRPDVGVRHGGDVPAPAASNTGRNAAPAQNATSRDALLTTVQPPRQRNVRPAADTADQPPTPASSGRMSAPAQDSSLSTVGMSSPQPSPLPSTVPPLNRRPIVGMASRADPMSPSFNQDPVGERHGGVRTAGPATTPVTTRTTAQNPTRNNGNAFFAHAAPVAQQAGSNATTGGDQQPGADGRSSPDPSPRPTSAPQLPRRQMYSHVPGLHTPPPSTAPNSPPPLPRRK